ncbi:hypothetical protein BDV10DRAFT_112108 [Aspergillus recurvatus]
MQIIGGQCTTPPSATLIFGYLCIPSLQSHCCAANLPPALLGGRCIRLPLLVSAFSPQSSKVRLLCRTAELQIDIAVQTSNLTSSSRVPFTGREARVIGVLVREGSWVVIIVIRLESSGRQPSIIHSVPGPASACHPS